MTNHLDNQLTTKTSSNGVMMCHVESLGKNGMEWWERIRVMSLQGWVHGCWSNVGTDHVFFQHAIMSAHLQHVMLPLAEILNVCLRINWYVSVLMFCVYSEDVEIKDLTHIPTDTPCKKIIVFPYFMFLWLSKTTTGASDRAKPTTWKVNFRLWKG